MSTVISDLPASFRIRFKDIAEHQDGKHSRPTVTYDGVPFVILGKLEYVCHYGTDKHKRDKANLQREIAAEDRVSYNDFNN